MTYDLSNPMIRLFWINMAQAPISMTIIGAAAQQGRGPAVGVACLGAFFVIAALVLSPRPHKAFTVRRRAWAYSCTGIAMVLILVAWALL